MAIRILKWRFINTNTSLAAKGALANRLQRRTACKIQNGRQGAPIWQRGSEKVSTPRFLGILSNFRSISFLIRALLLGEKVTTEENEKKQGKKRKEKTDENSDYYAVCQQSTARTTTAGTPHVRANRKVANVKMASVEV